MHNNQWTDFESMLTALETGNIQERAAGLILRYGGTDGSHHKQWLLDQLLRLLTGADYARVIKLAEGDPNDEDNYYGEWDEGTAP